MSDFKPLYTTIQSVKVRLQGKVTFESSDTPRDRMDRVMSEELLSQLIVDAEAAVEQDLRGRYAVPFRSIKSGTFQGLPDHTRRAIRTIVDKRAVLFVLSQSFGQGTHLDAENYGRALEAEYAALLRRLLGQDMEGEEYGEKRFRRTPPLEDLKLSATNVADDGFRGAVIDANPSPQYGGTSFAASRVNDPSLSMYGWGRRRGAR